MTARATCRNRRDTRCRCTADPTDFVTTNPMRGPPPSWSSRRTCTTISGCTARTPYLTVAPNSADRVIRYCVGSTVLIPVRIRQSTSGGPCGAGRTRWRGPHGCASVAGTRGPAPGAGCSAGRSACPWPRLHLLVASGITSHAHAVRSCPVGTRWPLVSSASRSLTGAVPGLFPGRCRIADIRATVRGY